VNFWNRPLRSESIGLAVIFTLSACGFQQHEGPPNSSLIPLADANGRRPLSHSVTHSSSGLPFTYVVTQGQIQSGDGDVKAACPSNETVFGGGYNPDQNLSRNGYIYGSNYGPQHGAWLTSYHAIPSGNGGTVSSYAVCAITFSGYELTYVSTVAKLNAGDNKVEAQCPPSYSVISGGWQKYDWDHATEIDGSHYGTMHQKWVINAYTAYSGVQVTAYGVCALGSYVRRRDVGMSSEAQRLGSYPLYKYVSNTQTIYAPFGSVTAKCPQSYYAVGGGFEAPYHIGATVTASMFGSDYQSWIGAVYTSARVPLTAYAVCGVD
jgi:hypothetical protein